MKISSCTFAGALVVAANGASWANSTQATVAAADTRVLRAVVSQALKSSPEIQAAQSAVASARARLGGAALPLNNPEFEAEAERTDINTYQLGISQTIDWHDKRSAIEQVARTKLQAAHQQLLAIRLSKGTELLEALGRIATHSAIVQLSQRKSDILSRFSTLAAKRHAAGDISRSELELAHLSLAEAEMQNARSQAALIQANSDFFSLGGHGLREEIILPESLSIGSLTASNQENTARQHPTVQLALLQAQLARQQTIAADRERKADPTLGISAGREDNNNLLALRFSMPLQIRNNFQSNVDAARHDALQAEQLAQQSFRELHARLKSAGQRYAVISGAWEQWRKNGRGSLQKRVQLLETLWHAGELSTTDYLLQVQQTLDTQAAGIELHGDLWNAWLEWMSHSAALSRWLKNSD
jgi:cobalt-zinc-cadmium efflux system outer membrane protein